MKKSLKLIVPVMVMMFSLAQVSFACGGEGKQCKKKKAKTEKSENKESEKQNKVSEEK